MPIKKFETYSLKMSEEVKEEIEALMSIYEEDMQSKKIFQSHVQLEITWKC